VKRALAAAALILAMLAGLYGFTITRRERSFRQLILQGEAALATDQTFEAIETFGAAIATKPDAMVGYLRRGEAYRRKGDLEAALHDLRQAVQLDRTALRPLELVGDVTHALGRDDRAADSFIAYLELDDRSSRVFYKLALSKYSAGLTEDAIAALKRAIAIDEGSAEAHYLLGLCERDVNRTTGALRALRRAVQLAPALLSAREELAALYGRLGRVNEWIVELEALRVLDPTPSRHVALGLACASAGRTTQAVATLRAGAERFPDHAGTFVALGRLWLDEAEARRNRVDLGKALSALQRAIAASPSSEALMLYGRALLMTPDPRRAEQILRQAIDRFPVEPQAFQYLADAAERNGHVDTARTALLDYRALEGDDPDPRRRARFSRRVADLSMRLNEPTTAIAWYQRAADAAPGDLSLLLRVAEAQWRAGDLPAARASLARVLAKEPSNRAARALARRMR
jgi:tetratricopeptide (TPR) repeat protein